jgi:hypothetical protein
MEIRRAIYIYKLGLAFGKKLEATSNAGFVVAILKHLDKWQISHKQGQNKANF